MTDYIMITRVSLFNNILKYYIDYFDICRFMVDNLMVTYYFTKYKGGPNMDDKV
jgi:hypothetical protein